MTGTIERRVKRPEKGKKAAEKTRVWTACEKAKRKRQGAKEKCKSRCRKADRSLWLQGPGNRDYGKANEGPDEEVEKEETVRWGLFRLSLSHFPFSRIAFFL